MDDFASEAMMRVIRAGLAAEGVALPRTVTGSARVPLEDKRELVAEAVRQRGLACLPRLGQAVARMPDEPLLAALAADGRPGDFFARWARLEKYAHSRHRTRTRPLAPDAVEVEHHALGGGERPLAMESLVVLGLQAALLARTGAGAVQARIDDVVLYPQPEERALRALCARGPLPPWRFSWSPQVWPESPRPVLSADAPEVAVVTAFVAGDLMRVWQLSELAARLRLSPRTLQRRLAREGQGLTEIVRRARQAQAARWLLQGSTALAEIGFLCGYADQAHFSRDFERATGLPPGRYRAEFGRLLSA